MEFVTKIASSIRGVLTMDVVTLQLWHLAYLGIGIFILALYAAWNEGGRFAITKMLALVFVWPVLGLLDRAYDFVVYRVLKRKPKWHTMTDEERKAAHRGSMSIT